MKIFCLFMLVLCALLGYAAATVIAPAEETLQAEESRWGHGGHHHHGGGGWHHGGGHHHGGGGWHHRGGYHYG